MATMVAAEVAGPAGVVTKTVAIFGGSVLVLGAIFGFGAWAAEDALQSEIEKSPALIPLVSGIVGMSIGAVIATKYFV